MKAFILLSLFLFSSCSILIPRSKYEALKRNPTEQKIANELTNNEFLDSFVGTICRNLDKEKCHEKFMETARARYEVEYEGASAAQVESHCKSYPVECRNEKYLERLYVASHNQTVDRFMEFNDKYGGFNVKKEWESYLVEIRKPASQVIEHRYSGTCYQNQIGGTTYQNCY